MLLRGALSDALPPGDRLNQNRQMELLARVIKADSVEDAIDRLANASLEELETWTAAVVKFNTAPARPTSRKSLPPAGDEVMARPDLN